MANNNTDFIKQVLYGLTRRYGATVTITRNVVGSTDYTTGVKTIEPTVHTIKRVIRLPENSSRIINLDLLVHKFSLPALPDIFKRQFIINAKELPAGFVPIQEDLITLGDRSYKIAKVEQLENKYGYFIDAEVIP